ncbi:MAG: 3,4-dihydroxy-2-butanone-4-phosphate synthase [Polyangiales bacterium]
MQTEAADRVRAAIEATRRGEMVIVVDDEDRENEGDLCMAAECVTPAAVNFMAKHARGLICVSLDDARVHALGLPMMVSDNRAQRSTAFTVSVEARRGVSTGISAADRAHTIRTLVDPATTPADLVSPGHVFPLRARPGGVLQRTGHTECSVDLARLAGCEPASMICEIMRDDGTMARQPDLLAFAETHGLQLISVADLVQYRLQTERLVHAVQQQALQIAGQMWQAHLFAVKGDGRQLLALTLGDIGPDPTLVRVHTGDVLGDALGVHNEARMRLSEVLEVMVARGHGVVLYFPATTVLADELARLTPAAPSAPVSPTGLVLREYGIGAQVLTALGLRDIQVLTNRPRRIPSLEGYGLKVVEQCTLREVRGWTGVEVDARPAATP